MPLYRNVVRSGNQSQGSPEGTQGKIEFQGLSKIKKYKGKSVHKQENKVVVMYCLENINNNRLA